MEPGGENVSGKAGQFVPGALFRQLTVSPLYEFHMLHDRNSRIYACRLCGGRFSLFLNGTWNLMMWRRN